MSIRTVIEINHDHLYRLKEDPQWAEQLYNLLASGDWKTDRMVFPLPNGVRVLGERHHSETLKLTVK